MSAETHLRAQVQYIRHLVASQFAILFLGCPDPFLRHPLISYLSLTQTFLSTDETFMQIESLSCDSTISALCDITVQTGLIWRVDRCLFHQTAYCLLAVPLESPRGTLGVLIFLDTQQETLLYGEASLLLQYLPTFVRHIEIAVHELVPSAHSSTDRMLATLREQNEFVSIVSHELRVPLTSIKGYAGLLHAYGVADVQNGSARKEMTTTRQRQYLSAIIEQVDHMEVLISDLLDVSRIQAGRLALHCCKLNISLLSQRILQIMQDRVDKQFPGLYCFRFRIESDLPLAWADPDRVQQILVNLLENAVKYSPDGGVIEMLACSLQEQIRITICDPGIGIPPPQQHTLFQPFARLKHPATAQIAGSGLGLYISRRLVEAMNGYISLYSNEGEGTRVTFTLPAICVE